MCVCFINAALWPAIKAMEWALNLLNRDTGTINGVHINDSYIPGVKLGKNDYHLDVCMYKVCIKPRLFKVSMWRTPVTEGKSHKET